MMFIRRIFRMFFRVQRANLRIIFRTFAPKT